jgi:hypothetical protein
VRLHAPGSPWASRYAVELDTAEPHAAGVAGYDAGGTLALAPRSCVLLRAAR